MIEINIKDQSLHIHLKNKRTELLRKSISASVIKNDSFAIFFNMHSKK